MTQAERLMYKRVYTKEMGNHYAIAKKFELKIDEIMQGCEHTWEDGENAILAKGETSSFCALCGEKFKK